MALESVSTWYSVERNEISFAQKLYSWARKIISLQFVVFSLRYDETRGTSTIFKKYRLIHEG